jgi:hypothetical protein
MENGFLEAVDAAVEEALPTGWPRVPAARLPARGGVRARHAFRLAERTAPGAYLVIAAIAAVPPLTRSLARSPARRDLEAFVDHVLSRGASLLLLYEDPGAGSLGTTQAMPGNDVGGAAANPGDAAGVQDAGDPGDWLGDRRSCPHPRLLILGCARDSGGGYTVEPTDDGKGPLRDTIRDLWSGELCYDGPPAGSPTVAGGEVNPPCRSLGWRRAARLDLEGKPRRPPAPGAALQPVASTSGCAGEVTTLAIARSGAPATSTPVAACEVREPNGAGREVTAAGRPRTPDHGPGPAPAPLRRRLGHLLHAWIRPRRRGR